MAITNKNPSRENIAAFDVSVQDQLESVQDQLDQLESACSAKRVDYLEFWNPELEISSHQCSNEHKKKIPWTLRGWFSTGVVYIVKNTEEAHSV